MSDLFFLDKDAVYLGVAVGQVRPIFNGGPADLRIAFDRESERTITVAPKGGGITLNGRTVKGKQLALASGAWISSEGDGCVLVATPEPRPADAEAVTIDGGEVLLLKS